MKKKNRLKPIVIILLIAAAAVLLAKQFQIKNFNIISPGALYTSGQPRGMDYSRLLYKYHIATIINLRSPAEHRERNWYSEEITFVRGNGVKYFELPLEKNINNPAYFPDGNMQEQFLAIMADKTNLPVLVHDSSGKNRPAMIAAVWLAKNVKCPAEKVLATAEKIKNEPLREPETKFIHSLFR
ncbi:MAG: tyrosine-protein phosphatase [Planctomycetota bacterium]